MHIRGERSTHQGDMKELGEERRKKRGDMITKETVRKKSCKGERDRVCGVDKEEKDGGKKGSGRTERHRDRERDRERRG